MAEPGPASLPPAGSMPRLLAVFVALCVLNHGGWFLLDGLTGEGAAPEYDWPWGWGWLIQAVTVSPALIDLALLWMVARRVDWARKVFVGWTFFCYGAFLLLAAYCFAVGLGFLDELFDDTAVAAMSVWSGAVSLATAVLLLGKRSSDWFKRRPAGAGAGAAC